MALSGCVGRAARFDYDSSSGLPGAPPPRQSLTQGAAPGAPVAGSVSSDRLVAFMRWRNHDLDLKTADQLADLIQADSASANVDERLLAALVAVESSFESNARSVDGAMGLGQLMPRTARDLGVQDPYDPAQNLRGTSHYLAWLLSCWNGQKDLALASYSTGLTTVRKQIASGQPLRPDQNRYVNRVMEFYDRLATP